MLEEKPKKWAEKFKRILKINGENSNKRKIENIVVFIVILIVTVVFINVIWNDDKKKKDNITSSDKTLAQSGNKYINTKEDNTNDSTPFNLEQRLENILQNIEGVGKVKVLITYSESSQTIAMYNEDNSKSDTEETDNRTEEIER